ncbi:acetyl-CoA acetyltransferase [Burkholderiales bacterium GJ-E10]|nr:acetyl-CoA acetyltransferase [Burkholderiales bacterium GJ-E10]
MTEIVILSAVRTPIGKFGGSLARHAAVDLGAIVVREALARARIAPDAVDEVILGQVLTAGAGQNPARQAAVRAGVPVQVPAMTVNQVCGSGLRAVMLAAQAVANGDARVVVAGGQESMSRAPHLLAGARDGIRMGDATLLDSMIRDGLWDAFDDVHMGITAENVAREHGISRAMQDEFAAASQRKAAAAQQAGRFRDEIVAVPLPQKKGEPVVPFAEDETIRPATTTETLARLRPAFDPDGTVTAGNASGINDGAAAVVVTTAEYAREIGAPVLARIAGFAAAGVEPRVMGMGPVPAVRRALAKTGWRAQDLDLLEINEAFAAQACAVNREMDWDPARVNVNGGAIALGHPIGASGCRILVTLLHEMARQNATRGVTRGAQRGLASLCVGGGMGVALAVER